MNRMTAVQDGSMAVRIHSIEYNVILEDLFKKMVKEEEDFTCCRFSPNDRQWN